MTAKDKPVSKPASDEYRSNYDKIFGGKMKSKIETLRDAYGAMIDTDVNFFFHIEGACDADDESNLSNFWRQATSMMPELLAFVDAVRDTMGEENMSEEVRHMLKELEKEA